MNLFDLVKTHVTITDVVGEYTTLKPSGNYLKAQCPFHQEKTASFTISPHRNIFYCFGCHTGGDAIAFVSKVENCSPLEAAHLLVERYQITVPDSIDTKRRSADAKEKNAHFEAHKLVALWCQKQLKHHPPALRYLQHRGITQDAIERFCIGVFPSGTNALSGLLREAREQQLLPDDLVQAQILAKGRGSLYCAFADRIMFPIRDHLGRYCGFGGRTFKSSDTRPKYYNSHESPFFNKGGLLFGLDLAKHAVQKKDRVFLVEGYTDCIALHEHGYPEVVATLGTACTINHLNMLSRYASRACIMYDNDPAGIQAIMRLAGLCWQASIELDVVLLPPGQDPASLLEQKIAIAPHIAQMKDIFTFFVETTCKSFFKQPLREKLARVHALLAVIAKVPDQLKQDLLLQQASSSLSLPFETLKSSLSEQSLPQKAEKRAEIGLKEAQPAPEDTKEYALEKRLFCAILLEEGASSEEDTISLQKRLPSPLGTVLQQITKLRETDGHNTPHDAAGILEILDPTVREYVGKLLVEYGEPTSPAEFRLLITQIRRKQWQEEVQRTIQKIESTSGQSQEHDTQDALTHLLSLRKGIVSKRIDKQSGGSSSDENK